MHRSSESVAGLATALAKAQIELINPEKSLVANIRSERRGEAIHSFRYAPLSSGLDIIRKTLGRHEIAVMQTTASDTASGMVNLTTLLAHTSGEWISSDWPVCPIAETATPHRMGAALTYARRYALFALVGIAGDDDLDAPDLKFGNSITIHSESSSKVEQVGAPGPNSASVAGLEDKPRVKKPGSNERQPILARNESAKLREHLLSEIRDLSSADAATEWALKALVIKNRLTSADAQTVEEAFSARLSTFSADASDEQNNNAAPSNVSPETAEKQVKVLSAAPRRRDKAHLRFVATHACLVCGRQPSDPHHLRFAQPRALGRKVSDEFTVPLCRSHHRELHSAGNESDWWSRIAIDPMIVASRLWHETHRLTHRNTVGLRIESPNKPQTK